MATTAVPAAWAHGLYAPLDHLGLIAVTGDDGADFLHNQLSNDVLHLPGDQARLAAYCSPKGRMLVNFLVWRQTGNLFLQCPAALQAAVQKRLSMFVLRAKAKLNDATAEWSQWGLAGSGAAAWLKQHCAAPEVLLNTVWNTHAAHDATIIRVPDACGLPRWLLIAPRSQARIIADGLSAAKLALAETTDWRWLDLRAGLPAITATTQERFVPQMINYEALGGVDFKKGCYPGQEVVARSQYLGKLKRRMAIAHAALGEPPVPGSDVLEGDAAAAQPVGVVVNAERSPLGGVDLLVELPLVAMESATLFVKSAGDAATAPLELLELPYLLPDNEVFVRPRL